MASSQAAPYWRLISVLFSSFPLAPAAAMTLYQAAVDLWERDAGVAPVSGDVLQGRVVNLKKHLALGAISGPAFEAELETARGQGKVRFLITSEGLEGARSPAPPPAKRRELLN